MTDNLSAAGLPADAKPDPGNSPPQMWTTPLTEDELAAALTRVDDPQDPHVIDALAAGAEDGGQVEHVDQPA
jgi:hypothetical protein